MTEAGKAHQRVGLPRPCNCPACFGGRHYHLAITRQLFLPALPHDPRTLAQRDLVLRPALDRSPIGTVRGRLAVTQGAELLSRYGSDAPRPATGTRRAGTYHDAALLGAS